MRLAGEVSPWAKHLPAEECFPCQEQRETPLGREQGFTGRTALACCGPNTKYPELINDFLYASPPWEPSAGRIWA